MPAKILRYLVFPVLILVGTFFLAVPPYVDYKKNSTVTKSAPRVDEATSRLHNRLVIADLHNDLLLWSRDPNKRSTGGHSDFPRLAEANVAVQVFSVVTSVPKNFNYQNNESSHDLITALAIAQLWPPTTWHSLKQRALYQAERLRRAVVESKGQVVLITNRSELMEFLHTRNEHGRRIAALLSLEGAHALEGDIDNLTALDEAGFRMMGFAHFFDNEAAGSAHGISKYGLTDFGKQLVREMNRRHIIIDLAHASAAAIDDILDLSARPVLVSHTGVLGTCAGPRNLSDAQIDRIGEQGGLIGIGLWDSAICNITAAGFTKAVKYVADRVGIEHVALGSDFDGSTRVYSDVTGLPLLTQGLQQAGFNDQEIALIMGGNTLRFLSTYMPD
jgi:membrane dipeptidase